MCTKNNSSYNHCSCTRKTLQLQQASNPVTSTTPVTSTIPVTPTIPVTSANHCSFTHRLMQLFSKTNAVAPAKHCSYIWKLLRFQPLNTVVWDIDLSSHNHCSWTRKPVRLHPQTSAVAPANQCGCTRKPLRLLSKPMWCYSPVFNRNSTFLFWIFSWWALKLRGGLNHGYQARHKHYSKSWLYNNAFTSLTLIILGRGEGRGASWVMRRKPVKSVRNTSLHCFDKTNILV